MQDNLKGLFSFAKKLGLVIRPGIENSYRSEQVRFGDTRKSRRVIILEVQTDHLVEPTPATRLRLAKGLAHELGHYIVAPKGRRRLADYGIRSSSSFDVSDENKAVIVERYLCQHFGFKIKGLKKSKGYEDKPEKWWIEIGKAQVDTLLDFL